MSSQLQVLIGTEDPAIRNEKKLDQTQALNLHVLIEAAGGRINERKYGEKEIIVAQGDRANVVMYIRKGSVKLTVVHETGKEAVTEILGPGDFLGEGCLAGQSICTATATAIIPTTLLVLKKNEMVRLLHEKRGFRERFIAHMVARNRRVEEALVDQLFNSSEKRLARILLLLAHPDRPGQPQKVVPNVSQELLAGMVGTTRSRINLFMNKFRKLGFIQYDREIHINHSLTRVLS